MRKKSCLRPTYYCFKFSHETGFYLRTFISQKVKSFSKHSYHRLTVVFFHFYMREVRAGENIAGPGGSRRSCTNWIWEGDPLLSARRCPNWQWATLLNQQHQKTNRKCLREPTNIYCLPIKAYLLSPNVDHNLFLTISVYLFTFLQNINSPVEVRIQVPYQ